MGRLWWVAVCLALLFSFATAASLELYTVPLAALQAPTEEVYAGVRAALARVGMLAVTLDAAAAVERDVALREFVRCIGAEGQSGAVPTQAVTEATRAVVLEDGTVRTTIAVATNHSVAQPLPVQVQSACPAFAAASTGLRDTVDATGRSFAALLDALSDAPPPPPDAPHNLRDAQIDSFLHAATSAESLEHFHLFSQPDTPEGDERDSDAASSTLQLHTDLGLFIVMTPGQYLELGSGKASGERLEKAAAANVKAHGDATARAGLYVQLPSGEVVTPSFPAGSLLVMAGEGAARWVARRRALAMYAAAHEVVLPALAGTGVGRAWYGRMFFPERSAVPLTARGGAAGSMQGLTFGAARDATHAAFQSLHHEREGDEGGRLLGAEHAAGSAKALGCHVAAARRQLADEGSCGAGQVYCWMSCQSIAQLDCDQQDAQCRNPNDASTSPRLWPQDYLDGSGSPFHCYDCVPMCAEKPPPPPPSPPPSAFPAPPLYPGVPPPPPRPSLPVAGAGFCNTYLQATVMWMTGFQWADAQQPCVAFLFKEWALDTRAKFAAGCVGTFLMGLSVEGIVFGRRKLRAATRKHGGPASFTAMVAVYGIQVTMGYFIMLIAMTYQTELFVMVVLGLTAGHAVFNLDGPVLESAEACCQGFDPAEETSSDHSADAMYLDLPGGGPSLSLSPEQRSCCNPTPIGNGLSGLHAHTSAVP